MRIPIRSGLGNCISAAVFCLVVLLLPVWQPTPYGATDKPTPSTDEMLKLGERMYREGILPSGEPMNAFVKGDLPVPGTAFTCASCHLRSGLGSIEGGVVTPPTNGPYLFKPFKGYSSPRYVNTPFLPPQLVKYNSQYYRKPHNRPVYTDESLANALRSGIDSAGRVMNDVMPRYLLEDEEMKLLVSYLKSLSSEFSPGVTDTTIRFATIVSDGVSPEERNAMLVPLENYVRNKNQSNDHDPRMIRSNQVRSTGARSRLMAAVAMTSLGVTNRKLSLSCWELKGAPETWLGQLEEYYRKEPVFAILGGITSGEWQPIHQFCEDNRIPNIFPITNFPVVSQSDWYTLYLSKGYYQEGEGAARFLNGKEDLKDGRIIQFVRDSREGRALSRGFLETWRGFGQKAPETITLKAGMKLTAKSLQRELAQKKPAAIILWDGPETLKTLEMVAVEKNRPSIVLVSSTYLGKSMLSLNERVQKFTYLTYPYGISQTPEERAVQLATKEITSSSMGSKVFSVEANTDANIRISLQTQILTIILHSALLDMRGNYYRDNLLDVIGMDMDQDVPLYERLSFGPGQRYASKGCYIVQLAKTGLVKKSGWVIH